MIRKGPRQIGSVDRWRGARDALPSSWGYLRARGRDHGERCPSAICQPASTRTTRSPREPVHPLVSSHRFQSGGEDDHVGGTRHRTRHVRFRRPELPPRIAPPGRIRAGPRGGRRPVRRLEVRAGYHVSSPPARESRIGSNRRVIFAAGGHHRGWGSSPEGWVCRHADDDTGKAV
jgi:hypothetical protein